MIIVLSQFKPETCGQTVLPDRSILIGQKLVENAKIQKFKCDILSNFQTMNCIPGGPSCLALLSAASLLLERRFSSARQNSPGTQPAIETIERY